MQLGCAAFVGKLLHMHAHARCDDVPRARTPLNHQPAPLSEPHNAGLAATYAPPHTPRQALNASPALDEYLAQADCLRALFVALNDESKDVRATAVQLVGRLAAWNPAYVAPALRRHLLQLLTDMDHSPDSKQRDDSAFLVNCLINAAPQIIMPYVSPIQKVRRRRRLSRGPLLCGVAPLCCLPLWWACRCVEFATVWRLHAA